MAAEPARTHRIVECYVLFIALICAPWLHSQTAADRVDAISSALRAGESAKAFELLQLALHENPGDPRLWTMQGQAHAAQNHTKEALAAFENALKISPDFLPALQGAAQIEFDTGSPRAIPVIERILHIRPGDQTAHGMLAVLDYQQGNCAAAAPHFEKSGDLFDARPDGLHAYATCLVKLREFEKATTIFHRSLVLDPGNAQERRVLASLQLMAHQPQDALTTLQPLLEESNTTVNTLELAATAYEDSRDTPRAVDTLRQAILLDPSNPNLYLDFANISSSHDSFQVGVNVLSDGIAQLPKAAPLYLARGVLYVQLAEYEKAESDFETAHELDPRQSLSSAAQGLLAAQKDDLERALAAVRAKLGRQPDDPLLLYLRADFLSQKGVEPRTPEFQLAMRSARRAVALQPSLSGARTVLAKLDMQTGNYREAVAECRKALDQDPKDQTALYHLIQALRKTGEKDDIPVLLKRLALLRKDAAHEESDRYRYKLVEDDTAPK